MNEVLTLATQYTPKEVNKRPPRERTKVGTILHLGAGRQSSCIAEMIVEGELPRVDLVIFADTGDEPVWVYEQVWHLIERFATMPLYTGSRGQKAGMMRRQCTNDWKIQPSDNYLRGWLLERGHAIVAKNGSRRVKPSVYVENWYGISADEVYRAGKRGNGWQKAVYPLISRNMRTKDCIDWLEAHKLPVPRKSSCIVCPYHEDEYWLDLQENYPAEFEHACRFDDWLRTPAAKLTKLIRHMVQECYLHSSCFPLREVNFREQIEARRLRRRGKKASGFQMEIMLAPTCATDGGFSCFS